MSTVTSPDVVAKNARLPKLEFDLPNFIVGRRGDEAAGEFETREEAIEFMEAWRTIHEDDDVYLAQRVVTPEELTDLQAEATDAQRRADAAERIAGDNESNGQTADASNPKTAVSHFGTLEIPVDAKSWHPYWLRDLPGRIGMNLTLQIAIPLAVMANRHSLKTEKPCWSFVVPTKAKTHAVCRVPVSFETMPDRPDSYRFKGGILSITPASNMRCTKDEAERRNDRILVTSYYPRVWNIAVRDLRDAPADDC